MVFGLGTPNVQKMEEKEDVKGLIKALGYEKESDVRANAADALGKIGGSRAVEPLARALRDPDWHVQSRAMLALIEIGKPAVEPLKNALSNTDWQVRRGAAEALGEIGDRRAVEPLTKALNDADWEVREKVAKALDKIRSRAVQV